MPGGVPPGTVAIEILSHRGPRGGHPGSSPAAKVSQKYTILNGLLVSFLALEASPFLLLLSGVSLCCFWGPGPSKSRLPCTRDASFRFLIFSVLYLISDVFWKGRGLKMVWNGRKVIEKRVCLEGYPRELWPLRFCRPGAPGAITQGALRQQRCHKTTILGCLLVSFLGLEASPFL